MNLLSALRRNAQIYGERVAVRDPDRDLTHREFYARVLKGGRALERLGVANGDRVAVLMLNSPRYLEIYYATAAIGAVVVPLNTRWGPEEVGFTLRDSGAKLLIVDDRFSGVDPAEARRLHVEEYALLVDRVPADPAGQEPQESDLAGLFYTSGTTGGPKGTMLTHRNLLANAWTAAIEFEMTPGWVWLHSAPMFHMADAGAMYALVLVGATHCFIPAFEPAAFLEAAERHRVNSILLVPTMFNMVMNHAGLDRHDLSSVSHLLYGASPMPLDLLRRGMDRLHCRFIQGYGMTETSPLLTVLRHEDHSFDDVDRPFAPVKSAGRAVIGVELRIVNDQDQEVDPCQMGEIVARGPNVMRGYWNRPEVSAEVLRGGWMHTGDVGAMDEQGFVYILDRKKDMIKTGGENVYSPEVEGILYAHPGVLEAAVIGVPDPKWGEAIKALVVLREGGSAGAPDIIEFCRARLTHFKCPTSVDFLPSLPKSGTGKIQKNLLRDPFWKR